MQRRYSFSEISLAQKRFQSIAHRKYDLLWDWIGEDCYKGFVRGTFSNNDDHWLIDQPNHRLDALLSPHWQTLLKIHKIQNEK